ncbi:MAG: 30S ribosomal protein S8 [Patescibacteria group bacterium]
MTDPIADMLTRIRNASSSKQASVLIPFSKVKRSVLEIIRKEGYIGDITEETDGIKKNLRAVLKYDGRMPAIRSIQRESKPGRRVYRKADGIPIVLNGFGFAILSTPKGMMSGKDAKKAKLGGELICAIY